MIRLGSAVLPDTGDDPLKDSIPEIIWSNLSFLFVRDFAFRVAPVVHYLDSTLFTPSGILMRPDYMGLGVTRGSGRGVWDQKVRRVSG
jgi:hypothetical protein